jgi:uncharacterized protein
VGCGDSLPKSELLRLVGAEGRLEPDPAANREGRGAYVCRRPECATQAVAKGFERSLRTPVTVSQETLDFIREWQRSASTR